MYYFTNYYFWKFTTVKKTGSLFDCQFFFIYTRHLKLSKIVNNGNTFSEFNFWECLAYFKVLNYLNHTFYKWIICIAECLNRYI